jgi:hypothetical protein
MAKNGKIADINLDYEIQHCRFTYNDMNKFEMMEDRRHIRSSQVNSILATLRAGNHFSVPMVVNKFDGKLRIIDGNHRYEALRTYLTENRDKTIEVLLVVYAALDEDGERKAFIKWNIGIKQTIDDLLGLMKKVIPLYGILEKRHFPVIASKSNKTYGVPLGLVIKALYGSYNSKGTFTASIPHRNDIVSTAMKYGEEEAKLIEAFFVVFRAAIGDFRDNKFLRPVFVMPAFNIYILNSWWLNNKDFTEKFSRCLNDTEVLQLLHQHSTDATELMRRRLFELCDKGSRRKMQRGEKRADPEEAPEA